MKPDIWRWANAQGNPISISLSDLRSALARGTISPKAWVWHLGWKHWLPASRVHELAAALGPKALEPQTPAFDAKQLEPPKVPALAEPDEDFPRRSTPVPPPPRRNQPLVRRPPAPTVSEEQFGAMPGTGTLRPPGAVPPPPRGIPKSMLRELEDWDPSAPDPGSSPAQSAPPSKQQPSTRTSPSSQPKPRREPALEASLPPEQLPNAAVGSQEPLIDSDNDAIEVPEPEISAPAHAPLDDGTIPYDPDASPGHGGSAHHPTADARTWLGPMRDARYSTIVALIVGALSLATGAWLVLRNPVAPRAPSLPPQQAVTRMQPLACQITRAAQRVAPRVFMAVAPIALDAGTAERVALGFAESATTAAGLSIDPNDLSVQFPYREPQTQKIISVTPIQLGAKVSYVTVREGIELSQARAVQDGSYFLFGVSPEGLARQLAGQPPETIWATADKAAFTDPRLATWFGLGHAVTFRKGGQNGTIQLGFLTESGHALSAPVPVNTQATMLGTPSLAVAREPLPAEQPASSVARASETRASKNTTSNGGLGRATDGERHRAQVLITFAGRVSENDPWAIYLSLSSWGKPPNEATVFRLPEGGPGGDAISPSLARLPEGHWLLQWSEGQTGQRQVRVQVLDAKLRPSGKAHNVSPSGSNSGQGLLWATGTRAVSFFVVSSGKQAELWASSLTCSK